MVKHRTKKPETKKKLTKWNIILPLILGAAGTGIAFGVNWAISGPPPITQCITSENLSFNQDAFLYVTLDGESFSVPFDVGRTEDCVKPVHTHENDIVEGDGIKWTRIHSAYVKPTRFTLSDFITLWGLDFNQDDLKVFAKTPDDDAFKEIEDIRTLVLTDKVRIKMELTSR
ncbi:MAG: hypothetical protein ACE5KA_07195 [Nitrososphaerales archaeon]